MKCHSFSLWTKVCFTTSNSSTQVPFGEYCSFFKSFFFNGDQKGRGLAKKNFFCPFKPCETYQPKLIQDWHHYYIKNLFLEHSNLDLNLTFWVFVLFFIFFPVWFSSIWFQSRTILFCLSSHSCHSLVSHFYSLLAFLLQVWSLLSLAAFCVIQLLTHSDSSKRTAITWTVNLTA